MPTNWKWMRRPLSTLSTRRRRDREQSWMKLSHRPKKKCGESMRRKWRFGKTRHSRSATVIMGFREKDSVSRNLGVEIQTSLSPIGWTKTAKVRIDYMIVPACHVPVRSHLWRIHRAQPRYRIYLIRMTIKRNPIVLQVPLCRSTRTYTLTCRLSNLSSLTNKYRRLSNLKLKSLYWVVSDHFSRGR